jgi:preprotein translocase subunit YajC
MNYRHFSKLLTLAALFVISIADAFAQEVPAQGADAAGQPSLFKAFIDMAPMLAICYFIFWLMVIRPQDKKNKERKTLLESLKKGDSVITTSGIVGRVSAQEEKFVVLEIAPGVKIKIELGCIARREKEEAKAAA